jgi:hypothetical protein
MFYRVKIVLFFFGNYLLMNIFVKYISMKQLYFKLLSAVFLFLLTGSGAYSQGCVPLRHYGGTCSGSSAGSYLQKGDWQAGASYRYFKSFRHFRGSEEEHERIEEGTEVINHSHALDFSITYAAGKRMGISFVLPLVYNERSSLYEHGGNSYDASHSNRHSTFSHGLADVRLGANYWILSPDKHMDKNIQVGLGVKFPTGEKQATDWFYNQTLYTKTGKTTGKVLLPVDQSIQPGDGGFGITAEINFFHTLYKNLSLYGSGFYLSNPGATNGAVTRNLTTVMSIPDQHSARAGLSYLMSSNGLKISVGGRTDGVPSQDLIGSSEGYRRPGYAYSIEPGVSFDLKKWSFFANVPVALYRNRTKSYLDKESDKADPSVDHHGDAAFADYVISVGATLRIPSCKNQNFTVTPSEVK